MGNTTLLRTKLYVPPVRPQWVSRARLIERLDAALGQRDGLSAGPGFGLKLTVLSAPAGFGKTSLLSEWASARVGSTKHPSERSPTPYSILPTASFAWLSLDEGDNDLARFLAYVIAALQETGIEQDEDGQIGKGLSDMLRRPQRLPVEDILTALINQISAISEYLILILDDYHVIHSQRVHDALAFLLEHLPSQMHVVIATRADPPLPLARLRGQGLLTELRQADLRFTTDEAAELLNRVMGLDLSAAEVAVLALRTEGWIAALHLAALQMTTLQEAQPPVRGAQRQSDVATFIRAFTGSDRYILDYLMEEVLHRQPASIQQFLMYTSVLTRLSAPLCDAVLADVPGVLEKATSVETERASLSPAASADEYWGSSQEVLGVLERTNLFIVPLDSERRWYRYHHLFADLLRLRLQQSQPELMPVLHGRASAWYEQNGFSKEAIEHALAAGDVDLAIDLIERVTQEIVMRSELSTFRGWVEVLPQDAVRARPLLCVFDAWALLASGCPLEVAEARLVDALNADAPGTFAGEVLAVRALVAAYQRQTRTSIELSSQALELLPETSTFFRSFVAGYLGLNYLYSGDLARARTAFEEAVRQSRKAGNAMNVVLALSHLAELSAIEGRLGEAKALYERALEAAVNGQGRRLPVAGVALCGLGRLVFLLNQLADAGRYIQEGIDLVFKWGKAGAIGGYVGQAYLKQAKGDARGAWTAILEAEELAASFDAMRVDDDYVAAHKATLCVLQGDLDGAAHWAEQRDLEGEFQLQIPSTTGDGSRVPANLAYEYLTLARLRAAQGRYDEALETLRAVRHETDASGWVIFGIRAFVVEAWVLHARGHTRRALDALGRALNLAEPEGYTRVFLDEGPRMAPLLYQALAQGVVRGPTADLARQVLAEFEVPDSTLATGARPNLKSETSEPQTLIEPLSERELEVLALISQGLTNREIAQRLHLSLSTVKVHTYNMYGKLDVHSRTQAVAKARGLGLLPLV